MNAHVQGAFSSRLVNSQEQQGKDDKETGKQSHEPLRTGGGNGAMLTPFEAQPLLHASWDSLPGALLKPILGLLFQAAPPGCLKADFPGV